MRPCHSKLLLALAITGSFCQSHAANSARHTPTVELIRSVEPAVVAIFSDEGEGRIGSGSGSVIHEDGFILTNDHVVKERGLVILPGRRPVPYRVIGRLAEKDLAIVKIETDEPMKTIQLGRSHDLMSGEPILVAGNPGGRGIVFSSGIVSSPNVMSGSLLALISSQLTGDTRDRFIQFDAASNRGNSGGPLINAEGRQIGVVSAKNYAEENINFAIPADRFRAFAGRIIAPEERFNSWTGIQVDTFGPLPTIIRVKPESPAQHAQLKSGDFIQSVDGKPIRNGIDWLLALVDRKAGEVLELNVMRRGQRLPIELKLAPYPIHEAVSKTGKANGLNCALHYGKFEALPDFAKLKPASTGAVDTLRADALPPRQNDFYALVFDGYIDIPKEGLYRITLRSDDGSRLTLNGRRAIDNDGLHPYQELSALVRVASGLQPIRVEFFEGSGDELLELYIEGEGLEKQLVAPKMFFRDEAPKK